MTKPLTSFETDTLRFLREVELGSDPCVPVPHAHYLQLEVVVEIDLLDAPELEIWSRDADTHELVRDVLDEFQGSPSRLSVVDWADVCPPSPGWRCLFVVRVRVEDGLDLLQAVSEGAGAVAFKARS